MDEAAQQKTASTPLLTKITAMKNPKSNLMDEREENNWCRHRRPSRSSMHQEEATIWSQWRIKLLYAVVVPAAIVYLLLYFDRQHQHQHRHYAYHPQQRHHHYRPMPTGPELRNYPWREHAMTQPPMVEDRTPISKTSPSSMVQHIAYDSFLLFGDSITQ
ncbi:hypothetical protein BG000_004664, partial [Podila horticola]